MASTCSISEVVISPSAVMNTGCIVISCVVRDSLTGAVVTSGATVTATIYRSGMVAISISPLTLSYNAGKYTNNAQMTNAMTPGHYVVRIQSVYNSLNQQASAYFDVIDPILSGSQY